MKNGAGALTAHFASLHYSASPKLHTAISPSLQVPSPLLPRFHAAGNSLNLSGQL
jgi:hypothetical protein